jgi:hypothetical protein
MKNVLHMVPGLFFLALALPGNPLAGSSYPQEMLFVPWGDIDPAQVRFQNEADCRFGPQSFRVDSANGEITLLDPLDRALKTYRGQSLIRSIQVPSGGRDFLVESLSEFLFLAGNQLFFFRDGELSGRFNQGGSLPLIQGIERSGGELLVTAHDGGTSRLALNLAPARAQRAIQGQTRHVQAVKRSPGLAELMISDPQGRDLPGIVLAVPTGNLGCLRVIGTDDQGRIYLDIDLVEQAAPLEVRREVWILAGTGELQGKLRIPTHYFTRIFRDLELHGNGDLFHMISAEDGVHVLKWSVGAVSGGNYIGDYPPRFQGKIHYNLLDAEEPDGLPEVTRFSVPRAMASTVTRNEAISLGNSYALHQWVCTADNLSDGVEIAPDGDLVLTPDWIVVGLNQRVPYKWGGFDTLANFDAGIAAGNYAGDIHLDGSSAYASGVDCSGFVCRCWKSDTVYTTREMVDPAYGPITLPYTSWDKIQAGDAVHKEGHVRLAVTSLQDGSILTLESAGTATDWGVGYTLYSLAELEGYSPRYYINMEGATTPVTIYSATSGSWTTGATWTGGISPTSEDNVVIRAGHTISIDGVGAVCRSISFGGNNALIDFNTNGMLSVYGDITLFSPTQVVFSAGWSATNACLRFAGSAVQTLRGWSTTAGSTSFRDVIVDKDGGRVTTDGTGMRLGIQNSLEIVDGIFELAVEDDLEGRYASSGSFTNSPLPNVTVRNGGEFTMVSGDGAHHIRSGYVTATATHLPVGTFTVYGKATFIDASTYKINLTGIDVESGGKLLTSTDMGGGEFECGALRIKSGGELENYTTSDCWGPSAVVTLDAGGLFDTKASTTIFPTSFINNGKVRYSREGTTDQTIVDMNYNRLEISLDPDNSKIWDLAGPRAIADTLKINLDATLLLTASAPQSLTVGSLLYLTSGQLNNSDPDVALTMANGSMIQRATGTLTSAPVFAGLVDLRYTSTAAAVTTGPEVPALAGVLDDFTLSGDQGVALGSDLLVGGVCTISGSDLTTGAYTVAMGPAATLVESAGTTVVGAVTASRTVAQAQGETFGGIGLELTAAGAAPGLTAVTRTTGVALNVNGSFGIERSFDVAAANNAGLGATVVFHYDESELAGVTETTLALFASLNGGSVWTRLPGTLDEVANTMTASGLASLAILTGRAGAVSDVGDELVSLRTRLVSLYPNPFNPMTRVVFELEKTGSVEVGIYDVRGQLVYTLAAGVMDRGRHDLTWRGQDNAGRPVASGVYFCRLLAGGDTQIRKLVLAR